MLILLLYLPGLSGFVDDFENLGAFDGFTDVVAGCRTFVFDAGWPSGSVALGFGNTGRAVQRLPHGSCLVKVKSDSLFGSEDQGGIGIWTGGAELLVVRP